MSNRTIAFRACLAAVVFALLAPALTRAQVPPMDMSWAIRSQQYNFNRGQAAANAAAMQYLQYMQQLRAAGYTGPSLPTGVTNESLRRSIDAANRAGQDYSQAQMANAQRRNNTAYDYDMRAIRGCQRAVDQYGRVGYAC
jgi:hypothetical protein